MGTTEGSSSKGFVDIHAHLLPELDDGPEQLAESVEMARTAAATGITTIAATPHLRADFPAVRVEELADRCRALRQALDHDRIPLRIVAGAEVSLVWALEASDEELRLATYDQRGTDLLIETPSGSTPFEGPLFLLQRKGFRITLAHPERRAEFQRNPDPIERITELGVLLQINADSLLARRGRPVRSLAEHLCRNGLAHAIASDGHRAASWRPVHALAAGVEALAAIVGARRAGWMASTAPASIIQGELLEAAPEIDPSRRRGVWRVFRG